MVVAAGPDFAAETEHGIVLVLEPFNATFVLQTVTIETSYTAHDVSESRTSISIFIFVNQTSFSVDFLIGIFAGSHNQIQ